MPTYATVTGQLVIPGTTTGVPGSVEAVPLTEGKVLTFPADNITTLGAAVAQVAADGTLTPPLEIPTDVPEGTLWRFTFKPKGRGIPTHLGDVAITASTDIADLNLSATEVTHVTPTVAANIAAAAALGATNDSATASFVENEASETHAALSATIASARREVDSAALGFATALDAASTSLGLQVLGDSTGVSATRWPHLVGQTIAADHPDLGVRIRTWNDATQKYDAPVTIQTPPLGERHAVLTGAAGSFLYLADSQVLRLTNSIDLQVKVALNDWTPATINALVSRYGGAGNLGFWFVVNTNGTLGFRYSTDGTAFADATSTVAPTVADGAALWVRVAFNMSNSNIVFYTSADGVTWTQLGTTIVHNGGAATTLFGSSWQLEVGTRSTGAYLASGKFYEVRVRAGIDGLCAAPVIPDAYAKGSGVTMAGSPTLEIINGSKSGADLGYLTDTTRLPKLTPDYMTLLTIMSSSHNDSNRTGSTLTALWDALLSGSKSRLPNTSHMAISQNPRTAPAANIGDHAARRGIIAAWARRNGLGFIDVFGAFERDGRTMAGTLVATDGIHPTDSDGSPLWAETVAEAITSA